MLRNIALIAPLVAWAIAQLLKFLLDAASKRKLDFTRLVNREACPVLTLPLYPVYQYDRKNLRLRNHLFCYGICLVSHSLV